MLLKTVRCNAPAQGRKQAVRAVVALGLMVLAAVTHAEGLFSPMLTLRMGDRVVTLEREQLDAMVQSELQTSTTLQPQIGRWQGVLGRDLLAHLGIPEGVVRPMTMRSWDDYRIDMTTEDFYLWDVLIATRLNGELLGVEDLGPLRVIYPRDQHQALQDSRFDHRWVWLLRSIEVTP
jgi:hypothetical protein